MMNPSVEGTAAQNRCQERAGPSAVERLWAAIVERAVELRLRFGREPRTIRRGLPSERAAKNEQLVAIHPASLAGQQMHPYSHSCEQGKRPVHGFGQ